MARGWTDNGLKVHVGMDNIVCVLRVNATFDRAKASCGTERGDSNEWDREPGSAPN
jgi:hypothetical protein